MCINLSGVRIYAVIFDILSVEILYCVYHFCCFSMGP